MVRLADVVWVVGASARGHGSVPCRYLLLLLLLLLLRPGLSLANYYVRSNVILVPCIGIIIFALSCRHRRVLAEWDEIR